MRFGPFSIGANGLLRDGKPMTLGQRGLALLTALAEADGPVSKAALMEAGWPGTVVEEGNLTVQIAALRKALGPRDDGQEWIVTVPRLGYRLLRGEVAGAVEAPRPPTLAVLPFQTLSGDPELAYFAEGMAEETVAALSRFKAFTVLSRLSSARFKADAGDAREVARELGASYLVEGSVRQLGARLRVAMRLTAGDSGASVWANSFDGATDEAFALQERVAAGVAAEVARALRWAEIALSTKERPGSGQVYDLLQRALEMLEPVRLADNRAAVTLLEQAIALEPKNAAVLSAAAWGYEQRIHMGWPLAAGDERRCLELAREAIGRAGNDATVLGHCGIILQLCAHDWELGLRTALRGVELNPNHTGALFFGGVAHIKGGELAEARRLFERASALSPDEAGSIAGVAHTLIIEGRFAEALELAEHARAMRPGFAWINWAVIAASAQLGRHEAARQAYDAYREWDADASLGRIAHAQACRERGRSAPLIDGLRAAGMPE